MLKNLIGAPILRFRLFLALFAISLCGVTILSSYGIYSRSAKVILDESLQKSQTQANSEALLVQRTLVVLFDHLERLGTYHELQGGEDQRSAAAMKGTYESMGPHARSLSYVDEAGRCVIGYEDNRIVKEEKSCGVPEHLIQECLRAKDQHLTEPYQSGNGEWRLLLSQPVFHREPEGENTYQGVLLAGIDPNMLFAAFEEIPDAPAGVHCMLVSGDGVMLRCAEDTKRVSRSAFTDGTSCTGCHEGMEKVEALIERGQGSEVVTGSGGRKEIVSYARLDFASLGWGLAVSSDYDYILKSLHSIRMYAIIIALIGIAIILPGTYLILHLGKKRHEAEERAKYLEKEKKLLEKIRDADREIGEHNRELTSLHELTTEVNKSLSLSEVIDVSLKKVIEITHYESSVISLIDDGGKVLRLKGHRGLPPEIVNEISALEVEHSIMGQVVLTGEAIFLDSMIEDPRHELSSTRRLGYHALLGIPLFYENRIVGVLAMGSREKFLPNARKQQWLKSIGSIVGMALGNCMLHEEVMRRAEEMSILYDVGRDLTSTIELPKLGEMVIHALRSRLSYPACNLLLLDKESEGKDELYVHSTSYDMVEVQRKKKYHIGKDGVTGWAAQRKETVYIPDVTLEKKYIKGREETKSELSIPLVFGEELLGVLDFEKDVKDSFSPDEIRFLTLFANQLSVALYNVSMFEETMRMNRQLNLVSERKSEFVSLVSHELRTPLTAIKSSIDIILLKMRENIDETVCYFLKIAKANVDRLSNMIDNILDISRIESGRMKFTFQAVSIKDLAAKAINNMSPLAIQKGLQIEERVAVDLPRVYADGTKMEQVFTNLLGNAIKFTQKGGVITVEASTRRRDEVEEKLEGRTNGHSEYVLVSVSDTGPGIPKEEHEEIFKRFSRIERMGKKGTGLGLAIAKYLVESHGGGIWVESEVGRGSTFQFLIPLASGEEGEKESR
jgi:signal transduction histidine kinase